MDLLKLLIAKAALLSLVHDAVFAVIIVTPMLGADTTLPCLVPKYLENLTAQVSWSKDGRILTFGMTTLQDKKRLSIQRPSSDEMHLHISSVKREDERTFICKVGKNVLSTVKVEIQAKPAWNEDVSSETQQMPDEYTDVTLVCEASGRPEPTITWYTEKDGQIVEPALPVTGSKLIIYNITRYQTDDYRCMASNIHDSVSRTISVDVKFSPEVNIYETEVRRATSEDVVFTCVIQGHPVEKSFWKTNNGATIPESNHWKYKVYRENLTGYPVTFLTLVLNKGQWGNLDYGTYKCIAVGPKHTVSDSVILAPLEKKEDEGKETVVKNYN